MDLGIVGITQKELAELDWLRKEAKKARRAYERARACIKAVLVQGGEVEPGPYEAKIAIRDRLVFE